jgi:uncharacterized protein (UPF0371 family)
MDELSKQPEDRKVEQYAREVSSDAEKYGKGNEGIYCGAAIELKDGSIITGKNSPVYKHLQALF